MRKILFATALGMAALLALPSLSLAQRHGGGGHGGSSGGSSGTRSGYYGGNGGYYGGNGGYYNHGGYGYGAIGYGGLYGGYYGNGWGIAVGVPVGGYNYGYRSPYYGGYGYSSPYYGGYGYSSPYYGSSYSYSPSYSYVQPAAPTTSAYTPSQSTLPPPTSDSTNANVVNMEVRVPANATLYIQGQKSDATGTERRFVSSALEPGRKYVYDLRATWMDANGKLVDRTKKVDVQAGAWVGVDMNEQ